MRVLGRHANTNPNPNNYTDANEHADGDLKLVVGDAGHAPELFDLAADLGEEDDLAARQPAQVKELKAMWDQWNAQMAPPSPPKDKAMKKAKTRKRKP